MSQTLDLSRGVARLLFGVPGADHGEDRDAMTVTARVSAAPDVARESSARPWPAERQVPAVTPAPRFGPPPGPVLRLGFGGGIAASPKPRLGFFSIKPVVAERIAFNGAEPIVRLASNEGALGPSPKAVEALHATAAEVHRFPDALHARLRGMLAARNGIDPSRIVCSNGTDEMLHLLAHAYAGQADEIVYSRHGFMNYKVAALAVGAKPVAAAENAYTAAVDNLLAQVTTRTRLVFLDNPKNPTGTYLPEAEIRRLHAALPSQVILVIDEAYAEYVDAGDYRVCFDLADAYDNVVITRTFSKIYGLGGVRLGWAYCAPAIADVLNRLRGPFNVSAQALAAGEAALADTGFVAFSKEHNQIWRGWLTQKLIELGFTVVPSVTNFVLVPFASEASANAVDAFLQHHGVVVRHATDYGLPECLRITVGREDGMQAVVDTLAAYRRRN